MSPRAAKATPAERNLLEKDWQRNVLRVAALYQWNLTYHTFDSRRSAPGFPDLILLKGSRMLAVELKREDGRLSPEQRAWLVGLEAAGIEVDVWRPSDLTEVVAILAGREVCRGVPVLASR